MKNNELRLNELGTAHHLCLVLGPKRNRLGKWFFRQPLGWVNIFLPFKGWVACFNSSILVG